jgi:hypothetical protein
MVYKNHFYKLYDHPHYEVNQHYYMNYHGSFANVVGRESMGLQEESGEPERRGEETDGEDSA